MSARACAWCGCSIEHKRPNAKTCNQACRTAKSRGQEPQIRCAVCDSKLEHGRDQRFRDACSEDCLGATTATGRGSRVKRDRYLTEPPSEPTVQVCECAPPVPVGAIDGNGFTVCSTCAKRRGTERRYVSEPMHGVGGPEPLRAAPFEAPGEDGSDDGLRTRSVNGVPLPKKVRQCAACGTPLRKGKHGGCCETCDKAGLGEVIARKLQLSNGNTPRANASLLDANGLREIARAITPEARHERYDKDRPTLERELGLPDP